MSSMRISQIICRLVDAQQSLLVAPLRWYSAEIDAQDPLPSVIASGAKLTKLVSRLLWLARLRPPKRVTASAEAAKAADVRP